MGARIFTMRIRDLAGVEIISGASTEGEEWWSTFLRLFEAHVGDGVRRSIVGFDSDRRISGLPVVTVGPGTTSYEGLIGPDDELLVETEMPLGPIPSREASSEPPLESTREALFSLAAPIVEAFKRAGYGVMHPQFCCTMFEDSSFAQVRIFSHTGAGGIQEAFINFMGNGECAISVTRLTSVPSGMDWHKMGRSGLLTAKSVASIPATTPDLSSTLLREVRKALLAE